MKIRFTKFKIFFLIMIVFFLYILGSKVINNTDFNIFFKIKAFIPNSVKHHLKNTIFIIPSLKKTINELEQKNELLKHSRTEKENLIKEIKNKFFSGSYPLISFHIKEKNKIINSKYSEYLFTKKIYFSLIIYEN